MIRTGKSNILLGISMLIIAINFIIPINIYAEETEAIKVAVWEHEGTMHIEDDGTVTGIEVDLLNLMTKYTGYKFDFVILEDCDDAFSMLEEGEIDVIPSMKKTDEREEKYEYTEETSRQSMMALYAAEGSPYAYQEYEVLKNIKIAYIETSTLNKNDFVHIYEVIDNPILIPYENLDDIHEALKNSEVEAAISEISNVQDNEMIIDRYNPTSNYYVSLKGSGIAEMLDNGLITIKTAAIDEYNKYLYEFNPRLSVTEFTREELDYIESDPELRVAILNDKNVMSDVTEDGKFIGILPDVVNSLKEISGLNLELVTVPDGSNLPTMIKDGKSEMSLGMLRTENLVNDVDFIYCDTILETSHILIIDKDAEFRLGDKHTIGIPKTFVAGVEYLSENYPKWEIVYPDEGEELFDLLEDGTADCIINQKYAYTYYVTKYTLEGYTMYPEDFWETECNLVISNKTSPVLVNILNKSILILKNNQLNSIIDNNVAKISYVPTFIELLNSFKVEYITLLILILIIVGILIYFSRFKAKQANELSKANKELIDAQKVAEENIQKAKIEASRASEMKIVAEKANNIKSDFIARMSHDMRTPMNAIIGLSGFGIEEVNDETGKRYFKQIMESSEYLLELVNDVLDIQKIQTGEIILKPEVNMMGVVEKKVLNVIKQKAEQKGVDIIINHEGSENKELVKIDQRRTEQLLINILNNAIKYTPEGGTVRWESHSFTKDNDELLLVHKISDSGVGMTEEFQKRMYEPFFQEFNTESKSEGGTGLGLAICKNLVDAMEGTIECESELGKGTAFTISIPVIKASKAETKEYNNIKKTNNKLLAALKGKNVLLCEDVAVNAEIVIKILSKVGVVVKHAHDGSVGVKLAEENSFDAILMDIRMPVMDGLTATKKIRQFDKDTPIIALSANAYVEDVEKSYNAGMNGHLSKPINREDLYETLLKFIK